MEIYDALAVSVAGRFVAQQTQVSIEYIDSDSVISLLGGGTSKTLAVVPAGRMMRVSWDMAVPSIDSSDMTFIDQYVAVSEVKIGVLLRGNGGQLSAVGYLQKPILSSAYGSNLVYSISWIGPQAGFQ